MHQKMYYILTFIVSLNVSSDIIDWGGCLSACAPSVIVLFSSQVWKSTTFVSCHVITFVINGNDYELTTLSKIGANSMIALRVPHRSMVLILGAILSS